MVDTAVADPAAPTAPDPAVDKVVALLRVQDLIKNDSEVPPERKVAVLKALNEAEQKDPGIMARARRAMTTTETTGPAGPAVAGDATSTSWGAGKTKTTDGVTTTTTGDQKKVALTADGVNYTSSKDNSRSVKDDRGSETTSSSTTKSVGTSGSSKTTTTATTVDGYQIGQSDTTAVKRGDGAVTASRSATVTQGEVDEEGKLTKGSTKTVGASGGVVAGPDGYGAKGGVSAGATQTHAKGVSTGQTVALDGKLTVNVTEDKSTEPPTYKVVLDINLGLRIGASGTVGDEKKSGSVELSASGSVTGHFEKTLGPDAAAAYVEGIRSGNIAASAGAELKVAKLAWDGALAEAQAALEALTSGVTSKASMTSMESGDQKSVTKTGSIGGTDTGKVGNFGLTLGASVSGSITRTVAKSGDTYTITLAKTETTSATVGGSANVEAVNVGDTYTKSDTSGGSVTLTVQADDPSFNQLASDLESASSVDEVRALAKKYPKLVTSNTISAGTSSNNDLKMGLGGVGVVGNDNHSENESVTVDADGNKTHHYDASSGEGMKVQVGNTDVASVADKSTVSTDVDAKGQATGQATTEKSESSWASTAKKAIEHPIDTAVGLATGSEKAKVDTDVQGMQLSDEDYQAIYEAAQKGGHDWTQGLLKLHNSDQPDWEPLRRKIAATGGDRNAMAKAINDFAHSAQNGAQAISAVVRPDSSSGQGGSAFEWPEGQDKLKATYTALVLKDPSAHATALAEGGDASGAVKEIEGELAKLAQMRKDMDAAAAQFDGSILAEMKNRSSDRMAELRKLEASFHARAAAEDKEKTDIKAKQEEAAQQSLRDDPQLNYTPSTPAENQSSQAKADEEAKAKADEINRQIAEVESNVNSMRATEQRKLDEIDKILNDHGLLGISKPDIYTAIPMLAELRSTLYEAQWEPEVDKLAGLYAQLPNGGDGKARAAAFKPNWARWHALNKLSGSE